MLALLFGIFLVNVAAKDPTLILSHSNRDGRQPIKDPSVNQEEWRDTEQTLKKGNGMETEYSVKAGLMLRNSDEEAAWNIVQKVSKREVLTRNVNCWSGSRWRGCTNRGGSRGGRREWLYSRYTWGWNQLDLLMDSMWVVRKREKWRILVGTPGTVHWCGKLDRVVSTGFFLPLCFGVSWLLLKLHGTNWERTNMQEIDFEDLLHARCCLAIWTFPPLASMAKKFSEMFSV